MRQQSKAAAVINRYNFKNAIAEVMTAVVNVNKRFSFRHNLAVYQN